MDKKSTLKTWKYLQNHLYFEKHRVYQHENIDIVPYIDLSMIKDKIVVEIGCGYGRETVYFAKHAKKVYAIEVSDTIIEKAKRYCLKQNGNLDNIQFVLADKYNTNIPQGIDFVYSRHVFQHLTPQQTQDYINIFYNKLNKGGYFCSQFYLGNTKKYPQNAEPEVRYTTSEILDLFKDYQLITKTLRNETATKSSTPLKHLYLITRK